jgi:hypothetical protein
MLPVALKKLISALPTACWLALRPPPKFGLVGGREIQREIQEGIVGIIAQGRLEAGWQVGVDDRSERARHAAAGCQNGILLGDISAIGVHRIHSRSAERRAACYVCE